jgi:hypothetical protein
MTSASDFMMFQMLKRVVTCIFPISFIKFVVHLLWKKDQNWKLVCDFTTNGTVISWSWSSCTGLCLFFQPLNSPSLLATLPVRVLRHTPAYNYFRSVGKFCLPVLVCLCVCATASDLDQSGTFWNWINWTHFVNARNSTVAWHMHGSAPERTIG